MAFLSSAVSSVKDALVLSTSSLLDRAASTTPLSLQSAYFKPPIDPVFVFDFGPHSCRAGIAGESVPRVELMYNSLFPDARHPYHQFFRDGLYGTSLTGYPHFQLASKILLHHLFDTCFLSDAKEKTWLLVRNMYVPDEVYKRIEQLALTHWQVKQVKFISSAIASTIPLCQDCALILDVGDLESACYLVDDFRVIQVPGVLPSSFSAKDVNLASQDRIKTLEQRVQLLASRLVPEASLEERVPEEGTLLIVVHQILSALQQAPIDSRKRLAQHIFLTGPIKEMDAFAHVLFDALKKILLRHPRFELLRQSALGEALQILQSPFAPHLLPWLGGSLAASLSFIE